MSWKLHKSQLVVAPIACLLALSIACTSSEFSAQGQTSKKEKFVQKKDKNQDAACKKKSKKPKSRSTLTLTGDIGACQLQPNGDQARYGVYGVVLTKPAPCDFKMPYVTVATGALLALNSKRIPIGTYWDSSMGGVSHPFGLTVEATGMPILDNGILLIQPDGKSYLIVDAGMAKPQMPGYQTAKDIANQISESLGFGPTELLKPQSGSAQDRFASTTVFKAGSVIAIYDDTPDMAGTIEVDLLIADALGANETVNFADLPIDSRDAAKSDNGMTQEPISEQRSLENIDLEDIKNNSEDLSNTNC